MCSDMTGKMIIFSAPSGAGKTTIVRHLLEQVPRIEFSVSACTREARKNEVDGKDYYFLSPETFRNKISKEEFVEWEEVYPDHYYGTLKSELWRIWAKDHRVIFDVDVKGGLNIKRQFPDISLAIFIKAPSVETKSLLIFTKFIFPSVVLTNLPSLRISQAAASNSIF